MAKLQNTPQLWSASLTCVGRLWRSRHNTIDAILIQWHVNELRGILKLLQQSYIFTYVQAYIAYSKLNCVSVNSRPLVQWVPLLWILSIGFPSTVVQLPVLLGCEGCKRDNEKKKKKITRETLFPHANTTNLSPLCVKV